mmetsp:Transcript_38147/g.86722  ORF Transcript_38147/g.86722 Transcript_38147/m.86722 type:complete len:314 (-) Transcript_38147:412-1353(-)
MLIHLSLKLDAHQIARVSREEPMITGTMFIGSQDFMLTRAVALRHGRIEHLREVFISDDLELVPLARQLYVRIVVAELRLVCFHHHQVPVGPVWTQVVCAKRIPWSRRTILDRRLDLLPSDSTPLACHSQGDAVLVARHADIRGGDREGCHLVAELVSCDLGGLAVVGFDFLPWHIHVLRLGRYHPASTLCVIRGPEDGEVLRSLRISGVQSPGALPVEPDDEPLPPVLAHGQDVAVRVITLGRHGLRVWPLTPRANDIVVPHRPCVFSKASTSTGPEIEDLTVHAHRLGGERLSTRHLPPGQQVHVGAAIPP